MSNWRIVNPALEPPQVAFESADEQAALREFAARDASAHGHKLHKSEDDGKTWAEVEARAPDAAISAPAAEKWGDADHDKPKHRSSNRP